MSFFNMTLIDISKPAGGNMEFLIIVILLVLIVVVLTVIDSKTSYDEASYDVYMEGSSGVICVFKYYLWQFKKKEYLRKIFNQGDVIDVNDFKYQITHGGATYKSSTNVFFEREIRFFASPLTNQSIINNNNVIIYQYGNGLISVDFSTDVIKNEIIEIENYLSGENILNSDDRQRLELFISKIKNNQTISKEELNTIYQIFLRYEPLASFSLSLFGAIQSMV